MTDPLTDLLAAQRVAILDGGLATELERHGADLSDELWSARLLADDPELIRSVHTDYLEAGADIIVSASYQATIEGFTRRGRSEPEAIALLQRAVALALEARDAFWATESNRAGRLRPLVAASVGPYGATLADGEEYRGAYELDETGLYAFHAPRFALLADSGAELLACETIPSATEASALARLLAEHPQTPAWLSFSCRDGERIADGTPIAEVAAALDPLPNLVAIGVNCTAPRFVSGLVERLAAVSAKPIVVYPNSGEAWDAEARGWVEGHEACDFGVLAREWVARGARIVGGCCRTGPAEVAAIRTAVVGEGGLLAAIRRP